ncbi:MAG: tetratricopeptide repeat protein [Candidatus Sumerlaeia bacterium]|nr:tetratricopeptide repeat protein [Candidatus Sumerlaeia bacterium]
MATMRATGRTGSGPGWRSVLATALTGALLALGTPASADTITLKNGQRLDGRVLEETADSVRFQDMRRVVLTLRKDTIESIERGENPLVLEEEGDRALAAGDLERALDLFQRTLELGADARRIEQKLAIVTKRIEERDLGPWVGHVKEIRQALEAGRFDMAQTRLDAMVETLTEDSAVRDLARDLQSDIHLRRALVMIDSIDYTNAQRELAKALEANPLNFEACIHLAELHAQISSRRPHAIELYNRVLTDGARTLSRAQRIDILDRVARLHQLQNDPVSAAAVYGQIHDEDPEARPGLTIDYVSSLVRTAERLEFDKPEEAIAALDKALHVQTFGNDIRSNLARILLAQKNYTRAIEEYEKLLTADPVYRLANHNLAIAYRATNNINEARTYLRREIDANPGNYDALVDLGDILLSMGDYEQAQALYVQARGVQPELTRATIALATSERVLGNYPAARRYLSELLARRPDDVSTNLAMGLLGKDEKKFDEATRHLDKVVTTIEEAGASDDTLRTQLADALLARGEIKLLTRGPATATADFNKALEVFPDYPAAYFNIGAAYEKKYNASKEMEDLKKAEENMQKARELDPAKPDFAFGLGVLYHQILASADSANSEAYFGKAVENFRDYLANGGPEVSKVEAWIRELTAGR